MIIDDGQMILRIAVSALLGALIGLERERQNQPAGLRTHMILAVGSTLAMIVSINIAMQFRPDVPNGDPARLAAQVVSGIGFLGAGAILRFGNNIRGLTTATSLWTLAIVGLAVGAGHFAAAAGTTVLLLVLLSVVDELERRFIKSYQNITVLLEMEDHPGILDEIRAVITDENTTITSTGVEKRLEEDLVTIHLVIKTLVDAPVDQLVSNLSGLKGAKSFKIS